MRFMRSYRKSTREDVNHEYLRRTRINTSKFLQTKSLLSRTENQQERESKLSQESGSFGVLQQSLFIEDSIQDNHTNGRIINIRSRHSKGYAKNQTQTRQSLNNIRENETKSKVDISSKLFLFASTILSIPLRLSSISLFIPSTKAEQKSNCEKNRFSSFNDLQKFKKSCKIKKYFLAEKQTSQSVIKVLNLLVNFIYFTILKPLLFGYKNIQFLDSCFIDNTKIKTTTIHQITCNKTEINQSAFYLINKFNKFQNRNGFRSGTVEHNSILKTKLKIFNNNLITYITFKTILNSFMCSLENFKLSFNKFLLNFCDKLSKFNFLREILYDTCKKFLDTKISYVIYEKCMELINGIDELYIKNNTNTYSYDTILKLNNFRNCNNYNNYNYTIDNYENKQKFFIKQIINKIENFLHKLLAQLKLKLLSYYNNDNKNHNNNIINESLCKSIIKKIHRICLMLKTKSLCEKLRTKCNLSVINERKYSVKNYINSDCELNENHIKHYNNNNNNNSDLIKCLNYVKYLWKTKLIHEHFNNNITIYHNTKRRTSVRSIKSVFVILLLTCVPNISESFHHNIKYSTNIVKTKYGPLRGIIVRTNPTVEAFLGVPYASPPVGSLRFMPPVTPSTWRNARLSDRFSAVCPQAAPVAPTGPEALLEVPRGRLAQLRRLLPLLANQSEDCLYLNLYVPRATYPTPPSAAGYAGDPSIPNSSTSTGTDTNSGPSSSGDPTASTTDKPVPAIVYIHGESYEWNSGNPYDGSVMAAHGNVIVVTINFRLGILGFLKTGGKGSAQGNFGLMDLVAALHWLRENLPAFGGDPNKVTVMGHGTGAALANVLVVSPVASDLVHRAILLSGSALSPWAIQKEPLFVKRRVAEQTGCHGDMIEDDLAPCLRTKSISELLAVKIDSPRFLPGFAPFVDGTVIVHPPGSSKGSLTLPVGSAVASTTGIELADFPNRELLFGLTTIESYLELSAQDLEFGFNETRRDRILRTYVRNVYHYHLNEIYSALKNEYTDWERPVRNPMGSRDAALELLSDGHTAAPLVKLGYLHSLRGGRSYFLHFRHQSSERDFPQRGGSVRGEDVPFCLGLPISPLFPHNYTKQDIKISRILLRYISNFAQTGNPNETPQASVDISHVGYSKSGLVSSSLTLSSPSSPSSMATVPDSEVAVKRQSEGFTSSVASLPSLLSSPFTLVKHSNDQYSPQLRGSGLQTSGTSPAFNSPSIASSSTAFTLSTATVYTGSGSGTPLLTSASSSRESTDFVGDPNPSRTGLKPKVKRNAVIIKRRRSKTVKRNPRQRSNLNGNKKFLRKKYPGDPSGGYVMADQGVTSIGSRKRPRAHYDNELSDDEEEEEEDDEGVEDEDEEEDEGNIEEDDFDAGEDDEDEEDEIEENSGRIRGHHMDEEDVEKFDRFDDTSTLKLPFWDNYDAVNQLYLELGNRIEIRNHYRGHKLSMWLSLIPQLHSPGDLSELPMRHHHFLEDSAQFYDGIIRPQITSRPNFPKVNIPIGPPILHSATTTAPKVDVKTMNIGIPATTTECPPNTTIVPTIAATRPQNHQRNGTNAAGVISANEPGIGGSTAKQDNNNLLRRLANSQYQSYTTALTVTIAVGCFLLLLNVLIFAGIYYQREKRANDAKKKEELREAETRCSSSPNLEKLVSAGGGGCGGTSGLVGSGKGSRKSSLQSLTGFNSSGSFGEYSCYDEKIQCKEKHALADICSVELPLKEFKCSSMSSPSHSHTGSLRRISNTQNSSSFVMYPPSYHHPPPKIIHHFEEQPDFSNNGVVTYQQFHKQQHQQTLSESELLTIPISCSSTVGTSTEPCNQSTQSELSSVQNVGTSVDDKAVGCTESNIDSPNHNGGDDDNMISPGIPNPPPPPKSTAPYQGGILRQPGPPTTPGSNKKRVQIQEISV